MNDWAIDEIEDLREELDTLRKCLAVSHDALEKLQAEKVEILVHVKSRIKGWEVLYQRAKDENNPFAVASLEGWILAGCFLYNEIRDPSLRPPK